MVKVLKSWVSGLKPGSAWQVILYALKLGVPGLLTSLLLVACAAAGAPGAKNAVYDLWLHAWKVHPLILVCAGFITTAAVAMQGADIAAGLDAWLVSPVLHFLAHVLCFSALGVIPLGLFQEGAWVGTACQDRASLVLLTAMFAGLGLIASAGCLIVHGRAVHNEGPHAESFKAKDWLLWLHLALAVVFFSGCIVFGGKDEKTSDYVRGLLNRVSGLACTVAGQPTTYQLPDAH
jgi:hypothetical protein